MNSSARVFFVCLALAALVAISGLAYSFVLNERLSKAITACEAEGTRVAIEQARLKRPEDKEIFVDPDDVMECSPSALSNMNTSLQDAQKRVVSTNEDKSSNFVGGALYLIASALVVLGILPASWYFFLRRLREIAVAIRGE